MIPVREVRPRPLRRMPMVVVALLLANLLAFGWELSVPARAAMDLAFVPRMLALDPLVALTTVFTAMFLHGGWMHLLGNLLFLWIFGPSVEEALGAKRFAALYLLSGVAAAAGQTLFAPSAAMPMLGASGAISGVLAAYVSLYPRRRIETLAFIFIWPIPALFFVVEWFAMNLFHGLGRSDGVAWWAHIGGFLAGLVLVRLLFPRKAPAEQPRPEVMV
ncbi:MAG: rhomboid family intramembrane serine protease, partial [Polyangiales bacterium]